MKVRRCLLNALVSARLAEAVDAGLIYDLERELLTHAQGGLDECDPRRVALVASLLRRGWRRLGDSLIGHLVESSVVPLPPP
jgi:hypothetical protein